MTEVTVTCVEDPLGRRDLIVATKADIIREPYFELRNALELAVASLPTDLHDLRAFLRTEGVVGHMGTCSSCPIANWLKLKLGDRATRVMAAHERLRAWWGEGGNTVVVVETPPAVAQFMRTFDKGLYVHLLCKDADLCACEAF